MSSSDIADIFEKRSSKNLHYPLSLFREEWLQDKNNSFFTYLARTVFPFNTQEYTAKDEKGKFHRKGTEIVVVYHGRKGLITPDCLRQEYNITPRYIPLCQEKFDDFLTKEKLYKLGDAREDNEFGLVIRRDELNAEKVSLDILVRNQEDFLKNPLALARLGSEDNANYFFKKWWERILLGCCLSLEHYLSNLPEK